jgi:hypothetical protein
LYGYVSIKIKRSSQQMQFSELVGMYVGLLKSKHSPLIATKRCGDNTEMNLKKYGMKLWIGLNWPRI